MGVDLESTRGSAAMKFTNCSATPPQRLETDEELRDRLRRYYVEDSIEGASGAQLDSAAKHVGRQRMMVNEPAAVAKESCHHNMVLFSSDHLSAKCAKCSAECIGSIAPTLQPKPMRIYNRSMVQDAVTNSPGSVLNGRGRKEGKTWTRYTQLLSALLEKHTACPKPEAITVAMLAAVEEEACRG
jgi:hypothetical protein